jgi:Amt family ammonium transporter
LKTTKKLAIGAGLAGAATVATVIVTAGSAMAQSTQVTQAPAATTADLNKLAQGTNLLWIVVGASLVMFMQAGFAALETGFCRAKNAAHTMSMNIAVFGTGAAGFFLTGYALMFGGYSLNVPGADWGYSAPIGGPLIGSGQWTFLWKGGWAMTGFPDGVPPGAILGFFLFMLAFMDTAATIPTGALAERWNFKSFCVWGFFCGAFYYPLFGAFTWGGGWLSQLGNSMGWGQGYVDFAGSGVVHAVGGIAAFTGAKVLGARRGKYSKDGKPRGLPGHSIALAGVGTLILMFGWFGFNAGSTLQVTDLQFGLVAANTAIAAAFGCCAGMFWVWGRTGKPDPGMIMNGLLAGLVAITAPCAFVEPWAAAVIGLIAGIIVVEVVFFVDQRLKIDDPVGAIGVHFANGLWGVLALGLFASGKYGINAGGQGIGWNNTTTHVVDGQAAGVKGLFYGDAGQLASQLAGIATIIVVMGLLSWGFFKVSKLVFGSIRSDEDDEIAGLDVPEMGVLAYPDFVGTHEGIGGGGDGAREPAETTAST